MTTLAEYLLPVRTANYIIISKDYQEDSKFNESSEREAFKSFLKIATNALREYRALQREGLAA